jgi:hypothetical protein
MIQGKLEIQIVMKKSEEKLLFFHGKLKDIITDFLHKLSTEIIREN